MKELLIGVITAGTIGFGWLSYTHPLLCKKLLTVLFFVMCLLYIPYETYRRGIAKTDLAFREILFSDIADPFTNDRIKDSADVKEFHAELEQRIAVSNYRSKIEDAYQKKKGDFLTEREDFFYYFFFVFLIGLIIRFLASFFEKNKKVTETNIREYIDSQQ